jgi:putative ABC transport system permease protein
MGRATLPLIVATARRSAHLVAAGLLVGGIGSVVLLRLLANQLAAFASGGLDPVSFAAVAVLLGAAALLACVVPARRASRVQPMDAMR